MDINDLEELNKRLNKVYDLSGSLENAVSDLIYDIKGMKIVEGYCKECRKDHKKEALTTMELIQKVYGDLKQEMESK